LDTFFIEIAILPKGHNFLQPFFFVYHFVDVHGRVVGQVSLLNFKVFGTIKILGLLFEALIVHSLCSEEKEKHVDFHHSHYGDILDVHWL
jgi:hypothetical protein